jgi:hypothetical protein
VSLRPSPARATPDVGFCAGTGGLSARDLHRRLHGCLAIDELQRPLRRWQRLGVVERNGDRYRLSDAWRRDLVLFTGYDDESPTPTKTPADDVPEFSRAYFADKGGGS